MNLEELENKCLYFYQSDQDDVFLFIKEKHSDFVIATFLKLDYDSDRFAIHVDRKIPKDILNNIRFVFHKMVKTNDFKTPIKNIFEYNLEKLNGF